MMKFHLDKIDCFIKDGMDLAVGGIQKVPGNASTRDFLGLGLFGGMDLCGHGFLRAGMVWKTGQKSHGPN